MREAALLREALQLDRLGVRRGAGVLGDGVEQPALLLLGQVAGLDGRQHAHPALVDEVEEARDEVREPKVTPDLAAARPQLLR